MTDIEKAFERISNEVSKIDKKENNLYFYILDTKGNASGSVEYLYGLALSCHNAGYNVTMLYFNDEEDGQFVGVESWLGSEYANLQHKSITSEVSVATSDILFVPDIFLGEFSADSSHQFQKMPCQKVAVFQNYYNACQTMTINMQLGQMGVFDCICNTAYTEDLVKSAFPYVRTHIVPPFIDERFHDDDNVAKKPIINLYCRDIYETKVIINDFYRRYPMFQWISFMPLNGLSIDEVSEHLRTNAFTLWDDNHASFGYTAVEAMKSGSIVIAKVPEGGGDWVYDGEYLNACCVWCDNCKDMSEKIANVVRSWMTDRVPSDLIEKASAVAKHYNVEASSKMMTDFVEYLNKKRKDEFNIIKANLEKSNRK